jgi:hypothetical protein
MKDNILFTSTNLDGLGAAVIWALNTPGDININYCNDQNIDNVVKNFMEDHLFYYDLHITFTDVCPSREVLEKLKGDKNDRIIVSNKNHSYAKDLFPRSIVKDDDSEKLNLSSVTLMLYEYYNKNKNSNHKSKLIVNFVNDINSFLNEHSNESEGGMINSLANIYDPDEFVWKFYWKLRLSERHRNESNNTLIEPHDIKIIEEDEFIRDVVDSKVVTYNIDGLEYGMWIGSNLRLVSRISQKFLARNPHCDIFINVDFPNKKVYYKSFNGSLRELSNNSGERVIRDIPDELYSKIHYTIALNLGRNIF